MLIVKMQGGLGNQMFQYALYCKLKSLGRKVKVDTSGYCSASDKNGIQLALKQFPVAIEECSRWEKRIKNNFITVNFDKHLKCSEIMYRERTSSVYYPEILQKKWAYLDGYWQTEKYFLDIREEIVSQFCFPETKTEIEREWLDKISATESVSIHIRRGDYLKHADQYGNICTREYYLKAIETIGELLECPHFFVFSDDKEWARDFLISFERMNFVDLGKETGEIYDMKLMAACKHNIIANSSFSWWASWLNQNPKKIVIAPKKWQNGKDCPDIGCSEWRHL